MNGFLDDLSCPVLVDPCLTTTCLPHPRAQKTAAARSARFLSVLVTGFALVAFEASAQVSAPYEWGNVAIGGGGFVSAVIPSKTNKNLLYARTDVGGAYRWNAAASRWIPLQDWVSEDQQGYLGVESIALDPKDGAKVYLLAGTSYFNGGKTAILRSTDFGSTFETVDVTAQFKAHGNGYGRQNGERLQVDPGSSNVLYVGTRAAGLFRSIDSGATWTRMAALNVTTTPNANGINFVWLDPTSVSGGVAQRIVVGVSRFGAVGPNLYLSTNAGASFAAVSGAPSAYMPHRAVYASNGYLYITYGNGAGPDRNRIYDQNGNLIVDDPTNAGQIWKYCLADGAWTNVTPADGAQHAFSGISVDSSNPQRLMASTTNFYGQQQQSGAWGDRIFISTNGGASWSNVFDRGYQLNTNGVTWVAQMASQGGGSLPIDAVGIGVTSTKPRVLLSRSRPKAVPHTDAPAAPAISVISNSSIPATPPKTTPAPPCAENIGPPPAICDPNRSLAGPSRRDRDKSAR